MLRIKGLKKSYTNSSNEIFNVIDIESFETGSAQQIAISGDSGCGKTTFLNLISGIIRPDSGEIFINETDITKLSESRTDRFRAENIGYIFQTFNLLA